MLSIANKNWIRSTIQQELKEALTCEVEYERFNKERGLKELKNEKVFLPEWWVRYLPEFLGAMRGLQSDTNKANNRMMNTQEGLQAMSNILIGIEKGVTKFIKLGNQLSKRIDNIEEVKTIESDSKKRSDS